MNQLFDDRSNSYMNQDQNGSPRDLLPADEKFISQASTPLLAAREFLERYGDLLRIRAEELRNISLPPEANLVDEGVGYRILDEKSQFDTTTVALHQTYFGLPVWGAGLAVHMKREPFRVLTAQSTAHLDMQVERPSEQVVNRLRKLTPPALLKILGLAGEQEEYDLKSFKVLDERLIIFQYEAEKRLAESKHGRQEPGLRLDEDHPTLPIPPIDDQIKNGQHYVALEVHFILGLRLYPDLRWVAVIEANTQSVLYLRAFVDNVNGMVFSADPMTTSGGPLPSANNAALNAARMSVVLPGLNPPVLFLQTLSGSLVSLVDSESPTVAPPVQAAGVDFNFNARTDGFAATNAYYHTDRFFRLLQDLGFSLASYMSGTSLPSSVDHRGSINTTNGLEVNAHCLGTGSGGILRTTFALADTGDTANPIGIACDWRVVLHELGGHGILYNHVNSANFGFAHSAGDSFAAILNDPGSQAPDRFVTFPWVNIGRRHDRSVASGWGWGGSNDVGGYSSEQILSTTHFRIYRSIGGDSADLNMRRFASRYAAYLIFRAIGSLTPATNPTNVSGYATALITADLGDWTSEGHSGGAYGKVIRWAFEKQGLYQAPGSPTPVTTAGAPPAVDVYIEDGRAGEYGYLANHWSCQAIWNRRANDGGTAHEEPVTGQTNYAYVKIKNRGTQTATNVVVKGFHCNPGVGLVWPNDWQPMTTAQLPAPNIAPNSSAEITVGPFEWTPSQVGHECMLMIVSATGDPSNINHFTAGDSIPEWRLVPHDNNIGQRNVNPVAGGGGIRGLISAERLLRFALKNPHPKRARMTLHVALPKFLAERGWGLEVMSAGGEAFALDPGESQLVSLRFKPGGEFSAEEVEKAGDPSITIEGKADGILVGGMTYRLDPKMKTSAGDETTACPPQEKCGDPAHKLLECMNLPADGVKKVRVKKITLEIELDDEC